MTEIIWQDPALEFLRKLDKSEADRIVKKVTYGLANNAQRYVKSLVETDFSKVRIGDYRLFVDYIQKEDKLIIQTIKHRKNAYKKW